MKTRKNKTNTGFISKPSLAGLLAFLFVLVITLVISFVKYKNTTRARLDKEAQIATVIKQNIEQSLNAAYSAVLTLTITIDKNGEVHNFKEVSKNLLKANKALNVTELLPNGIIKYIYPVKNNEAAYNLDLYEDPLHKIAAKKAVQEKEVYFAGPLDLVQNGKGIVGRLPVFRKGKFWGFSAVIIELENLIERSAIPNFMDANFHFQIAAKHPISNEDIYLIESSKSIPKKNYKSFPIKKTNWKLYVWHSNNYFSLWDTLPYFISGLLLALISGVLIRKILKKPAKLQKRISKQATELLDSETKFKAIFEQAGLGIALVDSKTGKILLANRRLALMLGESRNKLKEFSISDLCIDKELAVNINKANHKFICDIQTNNFKNITVKITNSSIESPNFQNKHIAIIENITGKRKTEENLTNLRRLMGMAIRVSKLGFWQWHIINDAIIWSERLYEIFEIDNKTLLNKKLITNYIHPNDLHMYKKVVSKLMEKAGTSTLEYRIITKNKNTKHLLTRIECQENADGKVVKMRGITIDVTQEKQAEQNLQSSYQTVLEQNKRLLNFSYIVSHNLRSHTSNIQGILSLLQEELPAEERLEMYTLLKEVTWSLDETLNDLNEVINIQNNKNVFIQSLSFHEYIEKAKKVLAKEISSNRVKIIEKVPPQVKIRFNPAYLESIFLNLISNAIKYRHPDRYPIIEITYTESNNQKLIQIKDNGIGINLEKYGKDMFGMYKKFTDHDDARGLGLFVSKNQMEAMGGTITVDSTLHQGSIFTLYFSTEL